MSLGHDELERRFIYHPPDADRRVRHGQVTDWTLELANNLDWLLPDGREKALAITKLEECRMWANAAIACEPTEDEPQRRGRPGILGRVFDTPPPDSRAVARGDYGDPAGDPVGHGQDPAGDPAS